MAAQDDAKRRKIAQHSLTVTLYVPDSEAHKVDNATFIAWNRKVVKFLEDAEDYIGVESDTLLEAQTAGGMQAPCDLANWRQKRFDKNAQCFDQKKAK